MRTLVLVFSVLALSGCEGRSPTSAELQAVKAYVSCLHGAARRLDDHRSEASVIAAAVVKTCSSERAITAAMLTDLPQEITMATTIVLDERNRHPD